jgi:4,5-dihydroxyphthalate decarboxylase
MVQTRVLRTVTRSQGNNAALKDGTVTPVGCAFEFEEVPVLVHAFRRMVREQAYDVSEMAFTTYLCAKAAGKPITALPVFLVRGLHHGAIVHSGAIGEPADLAGTRVGVNRGYTVTTGVWARGILQDYHGVDPASVTWVLSGDEHVAEYRPPANVTRTDGDLAELVRSGELAAAIGVTGDGLAPVIPDATEVAYEALRRDGLYPINHLVVVRDELLEHAAAVFAAFAEAKQRYVAGLDAIADPTPTDLMHRRVREVTGADPLPYGIAPNRAMIELLVDHALRQRILDRAPAIEDLFAPDTVDLTA